MEDDIKKYEQSLLDYLKSSKMDKDRIRSYTTTIVRLKNSGFILDKIWKYGQPPIIDGVVIRGRLRISDAGKLGEVISGPGFRWCDVFPIGIPFPDLLEVRAKYGEELEQFETPGR